MKTTNRKEKRIVAKNVNITIHKLKSADIDHWLNKAITFRRNVQGVLLGIEENHEEDKGVHAHIVIQFTTRQDLVREQFVKHFGTDSIHISAKPYKNALLMALGYVSKTGNTKQWGVFKYRGIELDPNPEVYRFQYQVKSELDAVKYFCKVIRENINKNKSIIKLYAKRSDAIGIWLQKHPTITNTLQKLACTLGI